jgi:hypothetical protein
VLAQCIYSTSCYVCGTASYMMPTNSMLLHIHCSALTIIYSCIMDSAPAQTGEPATEDEDDTELFSSSSSGLTKGALFYQRFQTAVHTALVTPPAAATWEPAAAALTAACAPPAAASDSQPSNYDDAEGSDDGMDVVVAQPSSAALAQSWQVLDGVFEFVLRGGAGGGVPRYDLLSDDELLSTALPHLQTLLAAVTAEISSSGSSSVGSSSGAAERLQLCLGLCHKALRLGARAWTGTTATSSSSSSSDSASSVRSKWEALGSACGQLAAAALATAAVAAAAKALALRLLSYLLPNTTTRAAEHGQLPPVTTIESSVVAAVEDMVALHFPLRRGETLADVGQARAHATLKAALLSALSRSGALGLLRCCYSTLR